MKAIEEFLSPTSVLTPSAVGGLIVTVALPLSDAFDLSFKIVVLVVSFLFGALLMFSAKGNVSPPQKLLYGVLNSLIIFSVTLGVGISVDSPPQNTAQSAEVKQLLRQISPPSSPEVRLAPFELIRSAQAQEPRKSDVTPEKPSGKTATPAGNNSTQPTLTKEQVETLKKYLAQQEEFEKQQQKHARRWSW